MAKKKDKPTSAQDIPQEIAAQPQAAVPSAPAAASDAGQPPVPEIDMKGPEEERAFRENVLTKLEASRYVAIRRIKMELEPGYVLRKVGQAYMVMPTGPRMKDYQGMITLNETGAFMYKEMQKPDVTEESLAEACKAEFDATDEEARRAVELFIQQCTECGLMAYEDIIIDKEKQKIVTKEEIDAEQEE